MPQTFILKKFKMENYSNQQDERLKEILEREYGFKFQGPFHEEVPQPRQEYVGAYNYHVNRMQQYLLSYIILDPFGEDHSARREFRIEFSERDKTSFLSRMNKLGGNNNRAVVRACPEEIGFTVKKLCPEAYQEFFHLFPPNTGIFDKGLIGLEYHSMNFDEKVAVVKRIDPAVHQFLSTLS